ncbi:MAG: urease accessory protein UreF [Gammaproteobacteria bacterium]|uniref:urease accessory protein UreF n=1 Tax=Stutzerimonas xanthomarina TaxID=271420 RepID=UPI00190BD309|nr:urease accessory protein UreF [Stutzerimonas xanthomarina]MBU0812930.1 urease accessory protein UreF [Gammaproteobacteria bacterium]MBK3849044.1 urease accessory protein UreF [Stutzerimonas xanthomarina]MBU0853751.1 urease accessory protein UreF [Gammaproteobacteria bacterium]MBU1300335.1 urease accessory protein UreF [Gammaproteobacteria bacterium]MBU1459950.1 urease accessory protein UreF [Gammaproteobacteria bacterium]
MNPAAFALLRLASPQLPIGGYSYSQGLEMAVEQQRVHDESSASRWLGDQLMLNLARFEAPLLLAHCQAAAAEEWDELERLATRHRASRETRELRLESRQMGYSLKQLLDNLPELDSPARALFQRIDEPGLALGWALAARAWGISPEDALTAWLWGWLENQLAVLMKTLPLGQQAAQRLTSQLLPTLKQAQRDATVIEPENWGSAAFGLALASMAHERQYSRLFRS